MYEHIETEGKQFYVEYDGDRTELEPVEQNGTKYVRTAPNDTPEDNLLQLQDC